jgi:hypothetical protein
MRKPNIREQVQHLVDQLTNGVRWDSKRNVYTLVYTKRELRNARRRANRLWKGLKIE